MYVTNTLLEQVELKNIFFSPRCGYMKQKTFYD